MKPEEIEIEIEKYVGKIPYVWNMVGKNRLPTYELNEDTIIVVELLDISNLPPLNFKIDNNKLYLI